MLVARNAGIAVIRCCLTYGGRAARVTVPGRETDFVIAATRAERRGGEIDALLGRQITVKPNLHVAVVVIEIARGASGQRFLASFVDASKSAVTPNLSARIALLRELRARAGAHTGKTRLTLPTLRTLATRWNRVRADAADSEVVHRAIATLTLRTVAACRPVV